MYENNGKKVIEGVEGNTPELNSLLLTFIR